MNARWMDTETGRFISPDPARQGVNWYVYAQNNPTTFVDPSGLSIDDMDDNWPEPYYDYIDWSFLDDMEESWIWDELSQSLYEESLEGFDYERGWGIVQQEEWNEYYENQKGIWDEMDRQEVEIRDAPFADSEFKTADIFYNYLLSPLSKDLKQTEQAIKYQKSPENALWLLGSGSKESRAEFRKGLKDVFKDWKGEEKFTADFGDISKRSDLLEGKWPKNDKGEYIHTSRDKYWVRKDENGIEQNVTNGAPIKVDKVDEGKVSFVGNGDYNTIIIQFTDSKGNLCYNEIIHSSEVFVQVGDIVKRGDIIALGGATGTDPSFPHSHEGYYYKDKDFAEQMGYRDNWFNHEIIYWEKYNKYYVPGDKNFR